MNKSSPRIAPERDGDKDGIINEKEAEKRLNWPRVTPPAVTPTTPTIPARGRCGLGRRKRPDENGLSLLSTIKRSLEGRDCLSERSILINRSNIKPIYYS
ncbi:hypothetical protein GWI33_005327 [Rhynchophorus ferrugineus]|uniref:Uncharacterized protein n=1 Tax=Rhynchophorus ferrugineus TaxID=354439 RepID=A0A834J2K9_RHYFE|nr:hypothetical protein GWI33_005327 [Rhynchophorus ferrugineus]